MSVRLTNSGGYRIRQGGHCLVRKNATTLYAVLNNFNGAKIEVWKSVDNGVNWSNLAYLTVGGGALVATVSCQSCCMDSAGVIRILYIYYYSDGVVLSGTTFTRLEYAEFNTVTESFQSQATVTNLGPLAEPMPTLGGDFLNGYTDCAIAAEDLLHIVYSDNITVRGTPREMAQYRNRTVNYTEEGPAPSWSSPIALSSSTTSVLPSLCIEGHATKKPLISVVNNSTTPREVYAYIGNAETPGSFSSTRLIAGSGAGATTAYNGAPQIMQTGAGNEVVVFSGNVSLDPVNQPHPVFCFHLHSNSWSSWTVGIGLGANTQHSNAALVTRAYGKGAGDTNILASNIAPEIRRFHNYNRFSYNAASAFTSLALTDIPPAPTCIKTRAANYWEPALHHVDFLVESGGDIYYDRFDLGISA